MNNSKYIISDGAMGTLLQSAGLPVGYSPELWNIEKPEIITNIAKQYIDAGSNIIYANTFGANRYKLKGKNIGKIVNAGIKAAKKAACGTNTEIALDIGPIGQLLEPLGTMSFDEAYDIFKEIVIAGADAGADIIVFETMSDLYEVKAGLLAAKENTDLPVWVTMTFEKNGRTFTGVTVPSMALTLTGLGADAIGFNCSLGPEELLPLVKTLSEWTDLPIILKPNAGLPDPATNKYLITPEQFASALAEAADFGVSVFGGCCGTTPEFIAELSKALKSKNFSERKAKMYNGLCSGTKAITLDSVRIIGERINPTGKKRFQQALRELDFAYITEQGIRQQDAGADILDVNVGLAGIDEAAVMKTAVKKLQEVIDLPLQIDSSNISAIEAGLRYYNGKPIVNSVNGSDSVLNSVLPLCKKYGAALVALTMDENGIPQTAEKRMEIARKITDKALSCGISKDDIFIDCLTLTVSAQQHQAKETLKAVRYVNEVLGMHTTLGVSNISFGLPKREHITVSFLTEALACGLDLPIVNPESEAVMNAIYAHRVIANEDKNSEKYIERFANEAKSTEIPDSNEMSIETAIIKGLKNETAKLTKKALERLSEIEIINTLLIPALDIVGEKYEKQELYLPQLINAANAASEGFEIIKTRLSEKGRSNVCKGKIIIATVKGDIHDIGKNIVKVVLENYGYSVIDLGKDVSPELIVQTAAEQNVKLIGLSALMTTTVVSMKETIDALRASGISCKIWVGGAVLTPEYAAEIGADFYAKDAKQSVDIAKKVLG